MTKHTHKRWWQEYTEELYKKGLNDLDNHDDDVTHLEPDILGCEVKWALGSFHEPLILIHQGADRMKTTITEN